MKLGFAQEVSFSGERTPRLRIDFLCKAPLLVALSMPVPYTVYVCAFDARFSLYHSIPSLKPVNFRHSGESSQ